MRPRNHLYIVFILLLLTPLLAFGAVDFVVDWSDTGVSGADWGEATSTAGDVNGDGYADILVGAYNWANGHFSEGIVYLYYGSADGPAASPDWQYESNQNFAQLGWSVSPAGDVNADGYDDFLAGAPGASGGESGEGRVFVFLGSVSGPTLGAILELDEEGARFGHSVAWAGDVNGDGYDDVLAGAPEWGGFGSPFFVPVQGAAALFLGGPAGPETDNDWGPLGGQSGSEFGYSVAGVGDVNGDGYGDVMVGSPRWDASDFTADHGKAYCYLGSATGLASTAVWWMVGESAGADLGTSVAYAGDVNGDGHADALIGSPDYTAANGAVYYCPGTPSGLSVTHRHQGGPDFGHSVSSIGDFNQDGFGDYITGGGTNDEARVYFGRSSAPYLRQVLSFGGEYGDTVAGAGDVDGDGSSDMLVTDPAALLGAGRLSLYYGGFDILDLSPIETEYASAVGGTDWGRSASCAGDLNGDGFSEFVVGAPLGGGIGNGEVQVYTGGSGALSLTPDWVISGPNPGGRFGEATSSAGDVNGDGYADLLVGEPGSDMVHVYHGSASGVSGTPDWSYQEPQAGSDFGAAVTAAGDLNGDGFADVAVGGPLYDHDAWNDAGMVRVFFGSPSGIETSGNVLRRGTQTEMFLGQSIAGLGDSDGDGFDDLAVISPGYDIFYVDRGGIFVFFGDPGGLRSTPFGTAGFAAGSGWDMTVGAAGDVNGDGFADMIVGEPRYSEDGPSSGKATVFLGNDVSVPFLSSIQIYPATSFGGERMGTSVGSPGDFGGNGVSSVFATSYRSLGEGFGHQAEVYDLSEGTAVRLVTMYGGSNVVVGSAGAGTALGDQDGDGLPEFGLYDPAHGELWAYSPHPLVSDLAPKPVPRALQADGSPVALRGQLGGDSPLEMQAEAWLPTGRSRLRLEYQVVREYGTVGSIEASSWVQSPDANQMGTPLSVLPTAVLDPLGRYRWHFRVDTGNPYFAAGRWLSGQPSSSATYGFVAAGYVSSVDDDPTVPGRLAQASLQPPYPNPFNPVTNLEFTLSSRESVRLNIYDLAGRRVRTVFSGELGQGVHRYRWDGRDESGATTASGTYHAVLEVNGDKIVQKMVLLK